MVIEHIAGNKYIIGFTENEGHDLRRIALAFYKSNRAGCIRKIMESGISLYNELIEEGMEHDLQFAESFKVMHNELGGDSVEFGEHDDGYHDEPNSDTTDNTNNHTKERKCGSSIESAD